MPPISIHALLAESDWPGLLARPFLLISIHALLAESDLDVTIIGRTWAISIHALLAESDGIYCQCQFLSCDFYPRSPCGERPYGRINDISRLMKISIHALLAESDHSTRYMSSQRSHFYPRSPCGERREKPRQTRTDTNFYPRSPCGERLHCKTPITFRHYFYPRSPCGERPPATIWNNKNNIFLSTLSLRRATDRLRPCHHRHHISIHALLAESDATPTARSASSFYFYPRSPCGERRLPASAR